MCVCVQLTNRVFECLSVSSGVSGGWISECREQLLHITIQHIHILCIYAYPYYLNKGVDTFYFVMFYL